MKVPKSNKVHLIMIMRAETLFILSLREKMKCNYEVGMCCSDNKRANQP